MARPATIFGAITGALIGLGLISASTPSAPRKRDRAAAAAVADRRGTLSVGASGSDVHGLQGLLARAGYPVAQDGAYGAATADAVRRFQADMGEEPSGVMTPTTLANLAWRVGGDLVPLSSPTGDRLSPWQVYGAAVMVETIRARAAGWGVPLDGVILAMAANAWAESRFRPDARNTAGEDSHGLFQCNRNGGLGTGYAVAQLRNPGTNTAIVLDEAERLGWPALLPTQTIDGATRWFTTRVERPANAAATAAIRGALALEYAQQYGIPGDVPIAALSGGDS